MAGWNGMGMEWAWVDEAKQWFDHPCLINQLQLTSDTHALVAEPEVVALGGEGAGAGADGAGRASGGGARGETAAEQQRQHDGLLGSLKEPVSGIVWMALRSRMIIQSKRWHAHTDRHTQALLPTPPATPATFLAAVCSYTRHHRETVCRGHYV